MTDDALRLIPHPVQDLKSHVRYTGAVSFLKPGDLVLDRRFIVISSRPAEATKLGDGITRAWRLQLGSTLSYTGVEEDLPFLTVEAELVMRPSRLVDLYRPGTEEVLGFDPYADPDPETGVDLETLTTRDLESNDCLYLMGGGVVRVDTVYPDGSIISDSGKVLKSHPLYHWRVFRA